ncbi:hypothetical protein [Dapis sp. BLCC M229]|uniref:hypothetical protein n=1 Tax=Dapis sp. BLCC M229 TaxID=3400188 RepID=UPI003CEF55E5
MFISILHGQHKLHPYTPTPPHPPHFRHFRHEPPPLLPELYNREEKVTFNDGAMTIKMQQLSREKYLQYYLDQTHPALFQAPKPCSK